MKGFIVASIKAFVGIVVCCLLFAGVKKYYASKPVTQVEHVVEDAKKIIVSESFVNQLCQELNDYDKKINNVLRCSSQDTVLTVS